MNFIRTFEARVADAFGAAPQGYTPPFSFKKLAKRAAKEMEAETFVIDGVDTAPALFTVLVAPSDDAAMRLLYPQLTMEIVAFIEAQAAQRGYVFVAEPLARFMVDPSLRRGKFAVFAENVDYETLERLREEEHAFLSGASAAVGGAAADRESGALSQGRHPRRRGAVQVMTAIPPSDDDALGAPSSDEDDAGQDGLDVMPPNLGLDAGIGVPAARAEVVPPVVDVPPTQLRATPQEAPAPVPVPDAMPADKPAPQASCLLVEHKSGRSYSATAPSTTIGRERSANDIVLSDPNVSRRHAELTYDGRLWRVRDLGSTNGTLVNDIDITQCVLRDGDIVTLGLTHLEFRSGA